MSERRLEAVVIGPGNPGLLRVMFGRNRARFVADVQAERFRLDQRMPNSSFVGVGRRDATVELRHLAGVDGVRR